MDKLTIVGTITLVILVFSVLLSFFLLTVKSKNKIANRLLAIYFIVFAIHISVFFYSQYIEFPTVLEMLRDQTIDLSSPLLFLYLLSNIYSDFKLRFIHLLHLLPLIIGILIFTPRFYGVSESERVLFTENFNSQIEVKISYVVSTLISLFYLVLMFIELKKYKKLLIENYSNTTSFNYKWLYQLTLVVSFIFAFSQFKQLYKFIGSDIDTLNLMRLLLILVLLGFLFWIVLKSMYQPELFKAIDTRHLLVNEELKKTDLVTEVDSVVKSQIQKLQHFMEEKEPFLDASLTIQKLAYQFGMSSRELSILINHHLNQHFFDFITTYRIKKAITLIETPSNKNLTILEILYDVGFNSKSPFNKAFKKHTGLTPTEYRSSI
ncbi:AraC family transcriptional regulator [Flavivirga abyssicola]|uniref:helix-turn-helix domain-containing protein n=1 Tax=Flavivirga abyssicola TaxID=3063533 RepID=UPI0026DFDAAD|nr:AraC family transcriptional regulator [Flavivirga sp. MEBiC07777]WVK14643.1 AraC family transcriptional regulator [Flavivirga sp. MEBiC07777]